MTKKPLAIDLFCGLGGWTEGLLDQGYRVIGFDIEVRPYPAQLILQDILTIHGSQFKDAALIVASPPCQAYSARAMPWARLRDKNLLQHMAWEDDGGPPFERQISNDAICNDLFHACFRIQREAIEAGGRHIPLVVENVKGAQRWLGRAAWHFGSFYLYGDVPALMPIARSVIKNSGGSWFAKAHNTDSGTGNNPDGRKVPGQDWSRYARDGTKTPHWRMEGLKTVGVKKQRDGHSHTRHLTNQRESDGVKQPGLTGAAWFDHGAAHISSSSPNRKQASAEIAKIPFPLAQHIARVYKP